MFVKINRSLPVYLTLKGTFLDAFRIDSRVILLAKKTPRNQGLLVACSMSCTYVMMRILVHIPFFRASIFFAQLQGAPSRKAIRAYQGSFKSP